MSEPLYHEEWIALLMMCQETIANPPANLTPVGFAALLHLAEKARAASVDAPFLRAPAPTASGQVPS